MLRGAPDFETFSEILEKMVEEIPPEFLKGVGGIFAVPDPRKDAHLDDVYLLGEYHQREDGKYVYLYYGSFLAMGWRSRKRFEKEMRDTLLHELRHHWEESSGLPDLRDEDEHRLEGFRRRGGLRRRRPKISPARALASAAAGPALFVFAVMLAVALVTWLAGP